MLSQSSKDKLIIGLKQTKKALLSGNAKELYIARDCDPIISEPLMDTANNMGVQVFFISTMKELGSMCSINVGASCAVVIK